MATTIEIKNIGPVKEANLEFNRINVFMGPQSSGKSTIAKLISYCTWVEKDVATSQSLDAYTKKPNYFKEHLERYHKLKGYFGTDSYILYKSDVVEIKFCGGDFSINWEDQYAYKRSKISYIPSERNMAILPDARKVELGDTNIRSFLFDWFDARKNYSKETTMPVLELGVDYYYNENSDEDHIARKQNNHSYDILLSNASSGLQSITPLISMVDYLTNQIYKQEEHISFEQEEKRKKVKEELARNAVKEHQAIYNYLFSTCNTQFIIEEPEQNLFPETQRDLVYYLLGKCLDTEKGHRLTITTHSPYILYALNNCMLGYLIRNSMPSEEQQELRSMAAWTDPCLVSVWEIEQGAIRPIKNSRTGTIAKHYFNGIMNDVMEEYYDMLAYLKTDDNER